MYRVLTDSIKPESQPTPITQCRNPCVIKFIILGLHPMIILQKKNLFVFKTKAFWIFTSMIICFQKSMCLLWVANFPRSHHRLRKPSHTFMGFHQWIHLCNQKDNGAFTQHIISFFISKPCDSIWTLSHFLSPHNQHQTQC